MPWGVAAAVVGAAGTAYGASKSAGAAKDAAKAGRPSPFNVETPFGNAYYTPQGLTASGGVGSQYANNFADLIGSTLADFRSTPTGRLGSAPFDLRSVLGDFGNLGATTGSMQADALGGQFLSNAQQALGAAGNFNIDQFAATQFDRLNRLAAPGEQTAANSLASRLFSQGRLGANDSRSGALFRELDLSQAMQRDARLGQALGLATSESQRLTGLANDYTTQFGALQGLGQQLRVGNQNQAQSLFGALRGDELTMAQFQNQLRDSLLAQATGGQTGVLNAYAPLQNAINTSLTGALGTATGNVNAAQFQARAGQQIGGLYAGLGAQLINAGGRYYMNQNPGAGTIQPAGNSNIWYGGSLNGPGGGFNEYAGSIFMPEPGP